MPASASYFIVMQPPAAPSVVFMWNCEVTGCTGAGLATTEDAVVLAMNTHMANTHPDDGYVAPPTPSEAAERASAAEPPPPAE
jgi:hypothetical protein